MALVLVADRQYTAPSAADSVSITPTGVAWTNSAYVTVLDPTPAACVLTGVMLSTLDGNSSSIQYDAEVNIATGAAAAEVVIATVRVRCSRSFDPGNGGPTTLRLPVPIDNIAAGVRLSARFRKNNTNTTAWTVAITYLQKPLTSTMLTTAVGPKAIPPAAASVRATAGSPAWVNGTWVQLRAASGLALALIGVVADGSVNNAEYELDLGTGGVGSEVVLTTLRLTTSGQGMVSLVMLPLPLTTIAAAARIAARLRSSSASATMDVSLSVLEQPL